jgi:hypothetical protein
MTHIPIDAEDPERSPWRSDTARWMVRGFAALAMFDLVLVAATAKW